MLDGEFVVCVTGGVVLLSTTFCEGAGVGAGVAAGVVIAGVSFVNGLTTKSLITFLVNVSIFFTVDLAKCTTGLGPTPLRAAAARELANNALDTDTTNPTDFLAVRPTASIALLTCDGNTGGVVCDVEMTVASMSRRA